MPVPAVKVVVPATLIAAAWLIAPLLVSWRFVPMVVAEEAVKVPVVVITAAPVMVPPRLRLVALLRVRPEAVTVTAPESWLPVLVRVMALPAAARVVAPPTVRPAAWVMVPPLVRVKVLPAAVAAVTAAARVMAPAAVTAVVPVRLLAPLKRTAPVLFKVVEPLTLAARVRS